MVAIFATAVFGQTKTDIKPPQLPKCVMDWVKKNMNGFSVDKAYKLEKKVDNGNVTYYHVRAMKGQDKQWLYFDNKCAAPKKISEAEAMTDPPRPLPPVKTPVTNEKKEAPKDAQK